MLTLFILLALNVDAGTLDEQDGGVTRPAFDTSNIPFTPTSIRLVMNHYQPQFQSCYEDVLATKDKPVEGKVMTSFTILPTGAAADVKMLKRGTTLREPNLHQCLLSVISGIQFPVPMDHKKHPIEYPINLKAIH